MGIPTTAFWILGILLLVIFLVLVPYILLRPRPERRVKRPHFTKSGT